MSSNNKQEQSADVAAQPDAKLIPRSDAKFVMIGASLRFFHRLTAQVLDATPLPKVLTEVVAEYASTFTHWHDLPADEKAQRTKDRDFSYCNFSGIGKRDLASLLQCCRNSVTFRRSNLAGVDLSHAVLSNMDLQEADLSGANLQWALLIKTNLSRAILIGANLSDSGLKEANLQEADLSHAILRNAIVCGANLSGAILVAADLSLARLEVANFSRTILAGAKLSEAKLTRETIQSAADIEKADLSQVVWREDDSDNEDNLLQDSARP